MFVTRSVRFVTPGMMFETRYVRFLTQGIMFVLRFEIFNARYDVFDSLC